MRICEELVEHIGLLRNREEAEDPAPACVSMRQHTSAYVRDVEETEDPTPAVVDDDYRQHTSAYVSIRQHTSAYVSTRTRCC
jgi:hypothetical protein